ncbi:hypothetical protein N9V96_02690 [Polaribacter sp.]|nr:hypothetical protein [Polaribacter sp.]
MNIKLLANIVFFISLTSFSQKTEIEVIAKQMFVDMINSDFDAIVDMTYPTVFDFVPKSQMKTVIRSMFEGNEQISLELPKTIPQYKISEIYKADKGYLEYAFITYDLQMKMTFHEMEFDEEGKKMMTTNMANQGMEVDFVSNNTINVLMKNRITVILKDHHTNNKWKMLNYDTNSPLFKEVTPSEIIEAGKKFSDNLSLKDN